MKPFALHAVLDYRKRLEDTARQRLSEAKRVMEAIAHKLREEREAFTALIEKAERLKAEGIHILELVRYEDLITRFQENIEAIEKNLRDKTEIMHQERHNLLRRARDRRMMERLKERQDLAWKGYLDKKELAMLDELAITRHDSGENN